MKRSLIVIGLLQIALMLAIREPVLAQSPRDAAIMSTAHQLYQNGQYIEAAQAYQQLVDQGGQHISLYYNLGNAYYRQGELGRAIVNYLRAEQLAPRDPDIQANLEAARDQTADSFGSAGRTLFSRWIDTVGSWITLNELAIATLVLWTIFGLSLFVFLIVRFKWVRRITAYLAVIAGFFLLIGAITLEGRVYHDTTSSDAVIIAEIVDAVSGPGSQFETKFTMHNGTEASLIEKRENWVKIALPDGQLEGWVPSDAIEEVEVSGQGGGLTWTLPFL